MEYGNIIWGIQQLATFGCRMGIWIMMQYTHDLPSGNLTFCHGKSSFLMGKPLNEMGHVRYKNIAWPEDIAMGIWRTFSRGWAFSGNWTVELLTDWYINGRSPGSNTWRYVSTIFLAIFCGDILLHRPYIGLVYGRYLQFRFLKWPLNITTNHPEISR